MRLCEPLPHPCRGRGGWGDEKKKGEGRERRERKGERKQDCRGEGRRGKGKQRKRRDKPGELNGFTGKSQQTSFKDEILHLKQSLLEKRERK